MDAGNIFPLELHDPIVFQIVFLLRRDKPKWRTCKQVPAEEKFSPEGRW